MTPIESADMEALLRAQQDVRGLQLLLPTQMRDTFPADAIGALLTVQLQHCDSIILLYLTGENRASAEALLRPMIECTLRLMWLCEDKNRAIAVSKDKQRFPSLSVLLKRLPPPIQNANLDSALRTMHGLTHGGLEQLVKHFSTYALLPGQKDLGVKAGILLTISFAVAACARFCVYANLTAELKQVTETVTKPDGAMAMVGSSLVEFVRQSKQRTQP